MLATTSLQTVDIEKLLAPIAPGEPSGPNLRYEGTYDRIRELRREEGELPQGVWQTDGKRADWAKVSELCSDVLEHKTKDLQIAAWLLEGWLNLYGFAGIAAGFELLRGFIDRFWDSVHPQPERGDLEYRAAPFTWINEKVTAQVKLIPFVHPEEPDSLPLSWSDWEMACLQASGANRGGKGKVLTQDDFQRALHLTPFSRIEDELLAVTAAASECSRTGKLLDRQFGKDAPSLQTIGSVLDRIREFIGSFARQMSGPALLAMADAVADVQAHSPAQPAAPVALPHPEIGSISSRAEAYHWLAAAAEFLARTEPHSPAPYLVRRAIRWGNLTLEEILPELVRNQSELADIARLLQLENIGELR